MVQSRKKGFTLIELIIGITILALLAVGLLAALDPAEQFAKARDTSTRNTLLEVFGALQRYEAAQESYPGTISTAITDNGAGVALRTGASTYNLGDAVGGLVTAGELKPNFKNAAGTSMEKIYVFRSEGDPAVVGDGKLMVCYRPTSKSFQLQGGQYDAAAAVGAATTWAADAVVSAPVTGVAGATCNAAGTDLTLRTDCVYCAQ
jgi:prepilin-type N-terminal cleavage/methylation domain-containing protein